MNIGISIVHYPSVQRRQAIKLLFNTLGDSITPRVFMEGNTWQNARNAWLHPPKGVTHHLLMEDDVLCIPGFTDGVRRAVQRRPDEALSFFSFRSDMRTAKALGASWVRYRGYVTAQALCLPVEQAYAFVDWCDEYIVDDWILHCGRMALWLAYQRRWLYTTAPNLVQHGPWKSSVSPERDNTEMQSPWFDSPPLVWGEETLTVDTDCEKFLISRKMRFKRFPPGFPSC